LLMIASVIFFIFFVRLKCRVHRGGERIAWKHHAWQVFFLFFSEKKFHVMTKIKIDKLDPPPILKKIVRQKSLDRGGGTILILPYKQRPSFAHCHQRTAQHTLLRTTTHHLLSKSRDTFSEQPKKTQKKSPTLFS
jgi:hypothetical protein